MTARSKTVTFALIVATLLLSVSNVAQADVSPHRYNTVLKKIKNTSGVNLGVRSRPVPLTKYRYRVDQLKNARRSCWAESKRVRATYYGGSTDGMTRGDTGYRGDHLSGTNSFAELSTNPFAGFKNLDFAALGGLPYRAKRYIHYRNRTEPARKRDVGAGGGRYPQIDLWISLADKLKFRDGKVRLTKKPCRNVF